MDRRIDATIARTQLGQIMELAERDNTRFIVDKRGEPSVVIMSIKDFVNTIAPPPDWLTKAWSEAKRRGLNKLTRCKRSTPKSPPRGPRRRPPTSRGDPGGH
ncbi:type II toxin-antitoxin system Phd/YefM family antitoxin [Rhodopila sp.]|uniref:type II toxin-antitoxin system Phd/YefM family antitoxin n=1 Tax=Rhodopila sp. TaxID=2480087 RepID=UPI003D0AEED1